MNKKGLIIDSMLVLDDNGMPTAPGIRQLVHNGIRELWRRDKSQNKKKYISDCIVIYYLGDPKSPAKQTGLSDSEALKMAIEQAGLPNDYVPDELVITLINEYYEENITEAGRVVENILKGLHNINLSIDVINKLLNDKLKGQVTLDDVNTILNLINAINRQAGEIPSIIKKLEEAKENLMYEKETEISRGGNAVLSSMDAENYSI